MKKNKFTAMIYFIGALFLIVGVVLLGSAQSVSAQTSTGTPMVDLTGTAAAMASGTPTVDLTGTAAAMMTPTVDLTGTAAAAVTSTPVATATTAGGVGGVVGTPSAVPTLIAPAATGTSTAVVPVTGIDLGSQAEIAAAQTRMYLNLGIVSLGVFLLVLGILIKTGKK